MRTNPCYIYVTSTTLPPITPTHPHTQSKHSVEFSDAAGGYQCYGIYDGHWGTKAAKFTSRTLHAHIQSLWLDWADETLEEAVREVSLGGGDGCLVGSWMMCVFPPPRSHCSYVHTYTHALHNTQAFIRTNQDLKQLLTLPSTAPPQATGGGGSGSSSKLAKPKPRYDRSGTTATIAMVFRSVNHPQRSSTKIPPSAAVVCRKKLQPNINYSCCFYPRGRRLLVANVGDSRAVLCCDARGRPVELTVDHVASDPEVRERVLLAWDRLCGGGCVLGAWLLVGFGLVLDEFVVVPTTNHAHPQLQPQERRRLEARGARVVRTSNGTTTATTTSPPTTTNPSGAGGVWRVEGKLALSRSIGDFDYDPYLSRVPHVAVRSLRREENPEARFYRYLILASDGLWDVMSNAEAVAFLEERATEMRRAQGEGGGEGGERGIGGPDLDYHVLARALTWEVRVCIWVGWWF